MGGFLPDATSDALVQAMHTQLSLTSMQTLVDQHLTWYTTQLPSWPTSWSLRYDVSQPTLLNFKPGGLTRLLEYRRVWKPDNPYDLSARKSLAR